MFRRDGVFYADGRGAKHDLGKHSLGTRDPEQALRNLHNLDQQKAIELDLAPANEAKRPDFVSIVDGWERFLEYSGRSSVLGGVAAKSLRRYQAVRDKHVKFCARHGVAAWNSFDKHLIEKYGNWLSTKFADRTVYLELTLLKSVNRWLIENKYLSSECKLRCALRRPQGTDTYCYSCKEIAAMVQHC
jgi:hypothetical protein